MSIQSEIERINNNVQTTLQTIADTGVEVGSNSDALPAAAAALANEKAPINHTHTAESIGLLPVIDGASEDGVAYTATVPWIAALEVGARFTMVPSVQSTNIGPTLDVNGLGANGIRCLTGYNSAGVTTAAFAGWLSPGKPVELMYNGMFWCALNVQRTSAAAIMGTVKVEQGGTGADNAADARENLNVYSKEEAAALPPAAHSHSYNELTDRPSIPSAYTHPSTHPASMITGLAAVATSGSYNDLSNRPSIPSAYTHPSTHAASMISAGTFAGQVVANSSGQTPGTSLLRNSKLVSADTNPTVNGEINWTYK